MGVGEKKVCEKSLGDNSGILGTGVQHYGENMGNLVLNLCLVFLCISRIPRSVFLVGVYPALLVLLVSLSSWAF